MPAPRFHVQEDILPGETSLSPEESHHLVKVMRLGSGAEIEVFDGRGRIGIAQVLDGGSPRSVSVLVTDVQSFDRDDLGSPIQIAAPAPRGTRTEWMIEKLSELGVCSFLPLVASRSVRDGVARGVERRSRWERLLVSSAKQCRRPFLMHLLPKDTVETCLEGSGEADLVVASLDPAALPWPQVAERLGVEHGPRLGIVGPEGGWTDEEEEAFRHHPKVIRTRLSPQVLRVETAAVALAANLIAASCR